MMGNGVRKWQWKERGVSGGDRRGGRDGDCVFVCVQ